MGRKIAIIGVGHVGAAVAHGLMSQGICDTYVLIDTNEKKVAADVLDFQDAVANSPHFAKVVVNDYTAAADADVAVVALGKIRLQDNPNADRFAELPFTSQQVSQVAQQLKAVGFAGTLIVISNPVDVVTSLFQHYTGLPKEQVIGTGTLLDTARMKRAVAQQFQVDPRSVYGFNLGEHGNSQFTAWSQVRVKGQPIMELLDEEKRESLAKEAMMGGHRVFYGKGYTSYGIASAAIRLITAVLYDSHEELPISHYHEAYGTYLSYPATVGKGGFIERSQLALTPQEEEKLAASAHYIQSKYKEILSDRP